MLADIAVLAPLQDGSLRVVCPYCNGGSTREKSMVINRTGDNVSARCFRAACGVTAGVKRPTGGTQTVNAPRYYTRPTVYPSPDQHAFIEARFDLPMGTVTRYSPETDRFILDVEGPDRIRRGSVAYSFSESQKALIYNERPEEPFIHYARGLERPGVLVVVEDWFSAEKLAESGVLGVALMGTHLSPAMVLELADFKLPTVIAFDKDAYSKSLNYLIRFKEQFKYGLIVWKLERDLKYVSVERIRKAVNDGRTDFTDDYGSHDPSRLIQRTGSV